MHSWSLGDRSRILYWCTLGCLSNYHTVSRYTQHRVECYLRDDAVVGSFSLDFDYSAKFINRVLYLERRQHAGTEDEERRFSEVSTRTYSVVVAGQSIT